MLRPLIRARHPPRGPTNHRVFSVVSAQLATPAVQNRPSQSATHDSATTPYISERLRAKNVLRTLDDALPRILDAEAIRREDWGPRMTRARDRVETSTDSRLPTVAVWSPGPSTARDLVTALLEDPLSSDDLRRTALARRWESRDSSTLRIQPQTFSESTLSSDTIPLASSWLSSTGSTILEVSDQDTHGVLSQMLTADTVVLVISHPGDVAGTFFSDILGSLSSTAESCRNLHIVVNNDLCADVSGRRALSMSLSSLLSAYPQVPSSNLHFVSSDTAIDAQALFRKAQLAQALTPSATTYSSDVAHFSQELERSGLVRLSRSLQTSLANFRADPAFGAVDSALNTASAATHRAHLALSSAEAEAGSVASKVENLRTRADARVRSLHASLFAQGDLVTRSNDASKVSVQTYLHDLPWWKLLWRVDGLGSEMRGVLRASYGRALERHLVFQTGRMSVAQEELDRSMTDTLTSPAQSSFFHSPLLLNSLEQQSSISSTQLAPNALLQPIHTRLADLSSPLTTQLHVRAQRLILQSATLSLGTPSAAWGAWAMGYAGPEVALGAGALGAVMGVRWAVGRWEKAKRRWWEGWTRVEEGLERDIQTRFTEVVNEIVLRRTVKGTEGLKVLIEKRRASMQAVSDELEVVEKEIQRLRRRSD